MKRIAVVRIRGCTGIRAELEDTLKMLKLTRINHCSIVDDRATYLGMIHKCGDYITWGEIDESTFCDILLKRGRLPGDKPITGELIKKAGFASADDYAKKFMGGTAELEKLGMKEVFRLHAPRKGHKTIKKRYPAGALGDRGSAINELLKRMM
ncbi:MAG: 50S ribosomal protein L30 [Candidatus Micrarchaeota archaeon]